MLPKERCHCIVLFNFIHLNIEDVMVKGFQLFAVHIDEYTLRYWKVMKKHCCCDDILLH